MSQVFTEQKVELERVQQSQSPERQEELGAGIDFSDPNSPLAPFYMNATQVVAVALCGILFLYANAVALWHTDIWMHLKFGEWIASNGSAPNTEPFCQWSDNERAYPQLYNLCQSSLYTIYHAGERFAGGNDVRRMEGGVEFLRLTAALLVLLRVIFLVLAYRERGGSLVPALLGLCIAVLLVPGSLAIFRPQSFGLVFFAILLLGASREHISWRWAIGLVALLVLWTNVHGSFLVGLTVVAIVGIGRSIEACSRRGTKNPFRALESTEVRRILGVLVICVIASAFLNSNGPRVFSLALAVAKHPIVITLGEWRPMAVAFESIGGGAQINWVFVGTIVLIIATHYLSPKGLSATEVLMLGVFFVATSVQLRMINWYSMVLPWALVRHWGLIIEQHEWKNFGKTIPCFRKTILCGVVVVSLSMWSGPVGWALSGQPRSLSSSVSLGTPWEVARVLKGKSVDGSPEYEELAKIIDSNYPNGQFRGSILCSETQGDFLTWALDTDTPTTVYSHVHLFGSDHWEKNKSVLSAQAEWWHLLDEWKVNAVVMEPFFYPKLRNKLLEDPRWRVVVDEAEDTGKPSPFFRKLVAIRIRPTSYSNDP